jgi:hypothetical protein
MKLIKISIFILAPIGLLFTACAASRPKLDPQDPDVKAAIQKAWELDDPSYVRLMADTGRGIHWQNPSQDETLLHTAADYGKENITRELLRLGADPNARMMNYETPLHLAAFRGRTEIARMLLEHKADPKIGGGTRHDFPTRVLHAFPLRDQTRTS